MTLHKAQQRELLTRLYAMCTMAGYGCRLVPALPSLWVAGRVRVDVQRSGKLLTYPVGLFDDEPEEAIKIIALVKASYEQLRKEFP
jgi:hypothetical protein